jgi:uncharacterized membrane protein
MKSKARIYDYFWISVMLKGIISAIEIVAGIVALILPPTVITATVAFLTQGELAEDPHDFISLQLVHAAASFSAPLQIFVAIYLLSRGLIKLVLVIALLKNKVWAYPVSLAVLGLFVLYQVYQIISLHSQVIVAITIFDLIVMYFIWREYLVVINSSKGIDQASRAAE